MSRIQRIVGSVRILVTGHTGFKGSWLTLYLKELGHEIHGLSLSAEERSLFNDLSLESLLNGHYIVDVRDRKLVEKTIREVCPEVTIHLAAQAFVIEGYRKPIETIEVNTAGTLNVLLASLENRVPQILIITTDKVYKTGIYNRPFVETDRLGGSDPYSMSKVIADLTTQSIMKHSSDSIIQVARAGNVIGGGDYGQDRLIPDLFSALESGSVAEIRYPKAIRPWQHVLDCVSGYWNIIEYGIKNQKGGVWNIGPEQGQRKSVEEVCKMFENFFSVKSLYHSTAALLPETFSLELNSQKAKEQFNWKPRLNIDAALAWTFYWYDQKLKSNNLFEVAKSQLHEYLSFK